MNNSNYKLIRIFEKKMDLKYSKKTIINYIKITSDYLSWCTDINSKYHDKYTSMKNYIKYLKLNKKYKKTTLELILIGINVFYKLVFNNHDKRPYIKTKRNIKYHSEKQVEKILSSCHNVKHKAILMLAYGSGLSVSEIINLKCNNIDFKNNVLLIKNERIVPISNTVIDFIKTFVNINNDKNYIFTNYHNEKIHIRSAQKAYNKACELANIKQLGIHSLRTSYAMHLAQKGINIKSIKNSLGHKNISTTRNMLKSVKINFDSPINDLNKKLITNTHSENNVCKYCSNNKCNICINHNQFEGINIVKKGKLNG